MKENLLLLTIFILTLQVGQSQTLVSGGIYTNTTWTLVNSPYIVTDSITLFPGVTLTIEPGVQVRADSNVLIDIRGTLIAIGTFTDSIEFTSNSSNPSPGIWKGILINSSPGDTSSIKFCIFTFADEAISEIGISKISNSIFINNLTGIIAKAVGEYLMLDNCYFINNYTGTTIRDGGGPYLFITNSFFIGNNFGLHISDASITNCTFCGNQTGIYDRERNYFSNCVIAENIVGIKSQQFDLFLINSTIVENDTGIILHPGSYPGLDSIHQNNICLNKIFNIVHSGSYNQDLTNNCWCDTNSFTISAKIYDGYDNISLGLIDFTPFVNCDTTILPDTSYCSGLLTGINHRILHRNTPIKFYPNPFNRITTLEFDNPKNEKHNLLVYNAFGQLLISINNITTGQVKIERTNLVDGLYFFQLQTDSQVIASGKFIIE